MCPSQVFRSILALCAVAAVEAAISPKVFIIDYYSDEQDAWLGIPEFNLLEQNITLPGLSMMYPDIHCTSDGSVCQLVAGEGEINAGLSTFALTLSPEFNLTQTYFLIAGDAGVNPEVATVGSVTFAQFAVQGALQYEIDAREKPENFSTGYIPQGATSVDQYPQYIYGTEVFQLNDALRQRAITFAKTATLNDTASAQAYRAQYTNVSDYAPALTAPAVIGCDTVTSDNWFSGALLADAFANFTRLVTNGSATYCSTQQEDNAVLEALLRGQLARRTDFSRVIHMRTASDFDRPPPGESVAENLFDNDGGYDAAIANLYVAGIKVVQGILDGWNDTFAAGITSQNFVGDIFGSLGGSPPFGPGSIFNDTGAPQVSEANVTTATTTTTTSDASGRLR
ncbi:purine nucleoside permease-like protein [Daedalea quercina L-15889]|uniref:Purine nucleoside permease-like protein n=1 Tax=Daedalea quercina L-15889 TaxID=1314783 RepID=A0A165N0G0_9APHY|nr:purine nucleoside permease-like protein [Daedalea quercina L-15889]